MTSETLTCPYCNASIAVPASLSAGQRIVCPRCGDSFPLRPVGALTSQPPEMRETMIVDKPKSVAGPVSPIPELSLPSRRSNGLVAALVIGLMLFMSGGGLAFMLMTQSQRRAQDHSLPPRRPGKQRGVPEPEGLPVVASVAPDKLAALGYLPSGVNLLLAARIPELSVDPIGAQMLRAPLKLGGAEYRLEDLPGWVGLRLEDIDHFVLAARVDSVFPPPFYLVIRTVQPYDEESLRSRLKATRVAGKKKLYAFKPPRLNLPMHLWFADELTVVVLFADKSEALPLQPVADLQQLPEEIRTVLKDRREPVAPVWIAGHSRDWSKSTAALFLNRMKKEELTKLAPLRTFGIWFVPEQSLAVKGVFACKDETGARGLEDYFRSLRGPDASFKTALDGPWLTLQFQTGPDFLARWMKH